MLARCVFKPQSLVRAMGAFRPFHSSTPVQHNTRQELCPPKPKSFATRDKFVDGNPRSFQSEHMRFGIQPDEVCCKILF
jgi:hypothetical protein